MSDGSVKQEKSDKSRKSVLRRSFSFSHLKQRRAPVQLLPLPDFPTERHVEAPPPYTGEVQLKKCKKQLINIGKRYYAELNKGILKLYKDRMARESDGVALSHEFKIDLSKVPVLYDDTNKRLVLLFKTESHSFTPSPMSDAGYLAWKDAFSKHRLHRQQICKARPLTPKNTKESPLPDHDTTALPISENSSSIVGGLDAVVRVMDECQSMHCMTVELLEKTTKTIESAREMIADVKAVQRDMKEMLAALSNGGVKVINRRSPLLSKEELKTARTDSSDDETRSLRRTMHASLASLGAAMNVEKKKTEVLLRSKRALRKSPSASAEQPTQRDNSEREQRTDSKRTERKESLSKTDSKKEGVGKTEQKKRRKRGSKEKEEEKSSDEPVVSVEKTTTPEKEQEKEQKEEQPAAVQKSTVTCRDEEPSERKKSIRRMRRDSLPAQQIPGETLGFKAFATIALTRTGVPISMYEPLTVLQSMCEELRFTSLLTRALNTVDPAERMALVTAFAVSGYNYTAGRARKPFNAIVGETFDYAEDGWKYHAEQVSHNPQISALHAEGKGWTWWQTFSPSMTTAKFSPCFEITCDVPVRLRLGTEEYAWNKVKTHVDNATSLPEDRKIYHEGVMAIKCNNGLRARATFKDKREVLADIVASNGKQEHLLCQLAGTWDRALVRVKPNGEKSTLFDSGEQPSARTSKYYGFTIFSCGLNELTPEERTQLPQSDARLRPDVRYLDVGNGPKAMHYKEALEQKQRAMLKCGGVQNMFFEKTVDGLTGKEMYTSNGRYWQEKESGFPGKHNRLFEGMLQ